MKRLKLYLCGPMDGCTQQQAEEWRLRSEIMLSPYYDILTPMVRDLFRDGYVRDIHEPLIVEGDKNDIDACDVVLAHLWKPSFGSPMEIIYAHMMNKLVISVVPEPIPLSPWVTYHSKHTYRSLTQAHAYLVGWAATEYKHA